MPQPDGSWHPSVSSPLRRNMFCGSQTCICGGAKENCPVFTGKVDNRLHIGFDDPDAFVGSEEDIIEEFRRVRDEIYEAMSKLQM